MSKYSEKFKDPRWQRKRLDIFQRDGFKCRLCEHEDFTLHVHHLWYNKKNFNTPPWEYPEDALITLCEGCHELEEELKKNDNQILECFAHYGITRTRLLQLVAKDTGKDVELLIVGIL